MIIFYLFLFYLNVKSYHIFPTPIKYPSRIFNNIVKFNDRKYNPFGKKYYEKYIKKRNLNSPEEYIKHLNSHNKTIQERAILQDDFEKQKQDWETIQRFKNYSNQSPTITINIEPIGNEFNGFGNKNEKSDNFEVLKNFNFSFSNIGGYENIKNELRQCIDLLTNYSKYEKYNVRIPKGLIMEGPPGNGKTMLAKGFAGETNTSFISVSGSQFQEKYVGVGSTRVRELFDLANKHKPCIVFIDEIDAIGRKRSGDSESSSSERDNTLNELLVQLDGFKNTNGIFLVGATNRIDLLDPALLRPGRIDKKIFINYPDSITRESILNIHLNGKPFKSEKINISDLVDITAGLSGAQIENILNEAMLNALRENREIMDYEDIDLVINKIMVGWQPNQHQFSSDLIHRIAIHEMGHALVGITSNHHSKVSKVIINLSAPKSPGYTMFESSTTAIYTREALFEHLMILLAGRIAEEIFYDVSVTTGAINDFEEAFKLAEKMIIYYGMGRQLIYPSSSDKFKEMIDKEVLNLINDAYQMSKLILINHKDLIKECALLLEKEKIVPAEKIYELMNK